MGCVVCEITCESCDVHFVILRVGIPNIPCSKTEIVSCVVDLVQGKKKSGGWRCIAAFHWRMEKSDKDGYRWT